jgi:hypothetical protein
MGGRSSASAERVAIEIWLDEILRAGLEPATLRLTVAAVPLTTKCEWFAMVLNLSTISGDPRSARVLSSRDRGEDAENESTIGPLGTDSPSATDVGDFVGQT